MTEQEMNTSAYEDEAERARDRIASTVDDLQHRLSPRTMVNEAVGSIQNRGSEMYRSASRVVREHPVAVSLIGLSLGLLLIGRDRLSNPGTNDDTSGDSEPGRLQRGWSRVRESASNAGERISDRANAARDYTAEKWHTARDRTADYATQARLRTKESLEENPLMGVVAGLVAGAVLGALLPRSERENELLGQTSDRLTDAAKSAARAARKAGQNQLDQLGLNADVAKAKLGDLAEQAKEVARTATKAATSEIKGRSNTGTAGA